MNLNLENKVVIITGAASGIGISTVKAFLEEGAYVAGGDLNVDALHHLNQPKKLLPVVTDMRRDADVENLVSTVLDKFGKVDVLFNNVGVAESHAGFLYVTNEQWKKTFDINLLGYVRATRAVLPHMLKRKQGVLLHTASEAAKMPNPLLPEYSVSKAAVAMLSKVLAAEFTIQGIRSNSISPACIRTPLFDKEGGLADTLSQRFGLEKEEALKLFVKEMRIPVGRLGKPEEVASLAVYLASDLAQYISGANFMIDGGLTPVV